MAWALLGAIVVATAAPLSSDRAVDVEVAWDLIDLPFTIDAAVLNRKSPLLLQDWQADGDADAGVPLASEVQRLHEQFQSILTHGGASHDVEATRAPQLRGAAAPERPRAAAMAAALGWASPYTFGDDALGQPAAPPAAAGAAGARRDDDEDSAAAATPLLRSWRSDDEDSPRWARLAAEGARLAAAGAARDAALPAPASTGGDDPVPTADHEDSPRWDLATGQRIARPAAAPAPGADFLFKTPAASVDRPAKNPWEDFETRFGSSDTLSESDVSAAREPAVAASSPRTGGSKSDKKKPLVWLHVHKAGGSLMCQMAKRNERVVHPEDNCNWKGHDGYGQSGEPYMRVPCAERARTFQSSGFTYGQVEREMDDNELCDEFRYGVMLREPMSLMHSLMNYEIWYHEKFEHKRPDIPPNIADWLNGKIHNQAVPESQTPGWVHLDNFQTRVLANAFDVPAGQIDSEHVERARAFLQNHGFMVHVLEDLPTRGEELFNELGWKFQPGSFHRKVNSLAREERPFLAEELEYLKDLNKYDYELYNGVRSSD